MTKREIKAALKETIPSMEQGILSCGADEPYRYTYIGSSLSLDPCGRYHHIFSPNGVTKRCERYWENLEAAASELGGWIESGEGDSLDTFFCLPSEEEN